MSETTASQVTSEPCARCFGEAEHDFGDIWLCTDCYYIAGSTCAGIPRPKKAAEEGQATAVDEVAGEASGGTDVQDGQVC